MRSVNARVLVIAGYTLFIAGSLLASHLSDDFSGPQFLASSLVRALAQSMVMMPLSAIAIAGIEREFAGSASALFNMMRNLGGAVGIAVLQTFLTKREQFHSNILSSQVTPLVEATRKRIAQLVDYFMSHGISDSSFAYREALVAVGRDIRHEAFVLAFSDTIIMQSAVLGLAFVGALFMRKVSTAPVSGGAH